MSVVYDHLELSGPGGSVGFTLSGPALLAPNGDGVARLHAALGQAAQDAGQVALGHSQDSYSPVAIREGWGLVVAQGVGETLVQITQASDLFPVVEYPTRPHDIRGNPLHFVVGGQDIFTTIVHHPGTPGKNRIPEQAAVLGRAFEDAVGRHITPLLQAE